MRVLLSVLVMSSMVLAGCSGFRDSRANPANWFGSSKSERRVERETRDAEGKEINPLIGAKAKQEFLPGPKKRVVTGSVLGDREKVIPYEGTLVDQVTALVIERTSSGAIVRATGLASRQGAFDVRLIEDQEGAPVDGIKTYTLRAYQPVESPQGPQRTRTLHAAEFISNADLEGIKAIRVAAKRNVQTSSRR